MDAIESKAELAIPFDAPIKAHNRKTYASFGDDGLTATANAYGHLIQITRYFGNEPSGFICVDLSGTPDPFHVTNRMKELQRSCEDSHRGMKIRLPERLDHENQNPDDLKWKTGKRVPEIQFYEDRWPCFVADNPWLYSEVQYFISGKTVYQMYTFSSVEGMEVVFPKEFPPLIISADLLLRHLDFVTEENPMNIWNSHYHKQNKTGDNYEYGTSANADTIFIKHRGCKTSQGEKDAILSISPYINDSLQSVGRIGQSANYEIKIPEQAKEDLLNNARVKITLAYTLELVSSAHAVSSPLPKLDLEQLKDLGYQPPVFVDDDHLNFTLRRNLEHILSVCSIPVRIHNEQGDEVIPIALTCGDISGHRIAKEASFYAFNFLLKAFRHFDSCGLKDPGGQRLDDHPLGLKHATCENSSCRMRFRIWKTCLGHLAWISGRMNTGYSISNITEDGAIEEIKKQGSIGPHYWASGQVIDGWEANPSVFVDREITDAPLQIIKFGEFCRITGEKDILRKIPTGLQSIAEYWVRSLHERNRSGRYAFPRVKKEQPRKFYLADHALIWWASKSLEELGLTSVLKAQAEDSTSASGQRIMEYSSNEIKTKFIKRFTMDNSALEKPMIATSRSSAETRFSLLMRETVLFYAADLGLFDAEVREGSNSINERTESSSYFDNANNTSGTSNKTKETLGGIWRNVIGEWTNTVDYQAQQEDQYNAHWDHPLQFALSIIVAAKNKCANSRLTDRMFDVSRKTLFESSSSNGLFPGRLDVYKRPILFDREVMRDTYWQATFEVPFILWKYFKSPPSVRGSPIIISESTNSSIRLSDNNLKSGPGMNGNRILNNPIHEGKVVNISDEWLYNELDCFEKSMDLSESNIKRLWRAYESKPYIAVASSAAQTLNNRLHQESEKRILGYIIDVPQKSNRNWNTFIPIFIDSNRSLYKRMSFKRTPTNAKKRLLHFCRATDKTASLCYISAFEHPDISTFFNKHKEYSKVFHEETNAMLNLWVTEFHLSFYQIVSGNHPPDFTCIPNFDHYDFPLSTNEKRDNPKQISRAVMSFRFDGDFFDRHWTCHFFEHNPSRIDAESMTYISEARIIGSLKAHPWKQRRVLELILFGRILQEMVKSSQNLLDEIKERILEGFEKTGRKRPGFSSTFLDSIDLFDEMTSNIFKTEKKSWNIFQYILQVVEEDLCENLTTIELWNKREERPEHDRPQWTPSNERNYRGAIYMLQKSNELLIQDLRLSYTKAKSLNTSLTKGLESARDEWEIESNDDIRLFTYVTVVFLPISFATGVFSMSSAPTKETLNSMTTTAGLALLATVIALLYAKVLYDNAVRPFFAALRLALNIPVYALRLLFRLVYLVLISLLAILPSKWIYLLRRYSISPIAYQIKTFFDQKIEERNIKINKKLAERKLIEEEKLAKRKFSEIMKRDRRSGMV